MLALECAQASPARMNHSTTAERHHDTRSRPTASRPSIRDRADPRPGPRRPRRAALPPDADRASARPSSPAAIATFELQGRWLKELVLLWWGIVVLFSAAARACCSTPTTAAPTRSTPRREWLRWLGIAALGNGASWGLAGGGVLPLALRRAAGLPRVPVRGHGVGRHPGVCRVLADLRALRARASSARSSTCCSPSATACSSRSRCWCRCSTPSTSAIAYRLTHVFDSGYRLRHAYGKLTEDHTRC